MLPQGAYRSVIWGSDKTFLFSYDPAVIGKTELISKWGFTDITKNWKNSDHKPVKVAVFSNGNDVELVQSGASISKCKAGERLAADLPKSFLFNLTYIPGDLEAISYKNGKELSKDTLKTTGLVKQIRLLPEKEEMFADGHDMIYVRVELVDENGTVVPDSDLILHASFQSNYCGESECFTSYR